LTDRRATAWLDALKQQQDKGLNDINVKMIDSSKMTANNSLDEAAKKLETRSKPYLLVIKMGCR